jgi:hypothetical protein
MVLSFNKIAVNGQCIVFEKGQHQFFSFKKKSLGQKTENREPAYYQKISG